MVKTKVLQTVGRRIWNDILASGSGHLAAAWLEAANLERFFGNVNIARKMLYRAINSASDHPYMVFFFEICWDRSNVYSFIMGANVLLGGKK